MIFTTNLEELYNLYFKDVYKYALSLSRNESVAEEITQETFFKAIKGIEGFKGNCKIRVWLCQIAKNSYFSYLEKEKKLARHNTLTQSESTEDDFLKSESLIEVHKALHLLSEPYKEVFTLRVLGDLSYMQIAELFCKTESWARVTYYRAKIMLKEMLK